MNSAFLSQIEEENRILEQELEQLLKHRVRIVSQKRPRVDKDEQIDIINHDENENPNRGDLSKIDEETEEEQLNRIKSHRLLESPQNQNLQLIIYKILQIIIWINVAEVKYIQIDNHKKIQKVQINRQNHLKQDHQGQEKQ